MPAWMPDMRSSVTIRSWESKRHVSIPRAMATVFGRLLMCSANSVARQRFTPDKNELQWETLPVPQAGPGDTVTFNWIQGVGSSLWDDRPEARLHVTLFFNGKPLMTYSINAPDREWTVTEGGSTLKYYGLAYRNIEASGLMSLTVPRSLSNPGHPNSIKMVGDVRKDGNGFTGVIERNSMQP